MSTILVELDLVANDLFFTWRRQFWSNRAERVSVTTVQTPIRRTVILAAIRFARSQETTLFSDPGKNPVIRMFAPQNEDTRPLETLFLR